MPKGCVPSSKGKGHAGIGFDGYFELRNPKQLIGTSRSRFESHACHSDKSGDIPIAGKIHMKGHLKIKGETKDEAGYGVDEWYAFCLPEPVFINFEVGVNGELDLQRFYSCIMKIVELGWQKGLRKLIGLIQVVLTWRSWRLSTGITLWFIVTHTWDWMLYPSVPLVWMGAVYLLNNEKWSKKILAHEATATFDQEGFEQVAYFNSAARMATYVERVLLEKMNGQVDNYQGLTDFAGRLMDNTGKLRVNYGHLVQALKDPENDNWITWMKEVEKNTEETPGWLRRVPPWLVPKGMKNNIMQWSDQAASIVQQLEGLHQFKEAVFVEPANSRLFYVGMLILSALMFYVFGMSSMAEVGGAMHRPANVDPKTGEKYCAKHRQTMFEVGLTNMHSGQIMIFIFVMVSCTPPFRFLRTYLRVRRQFVWALQRRARGGCDCWDFYTAASVADSMGSDFQTTNSGADSAVSEGS